MDLLRFADHRATEITLIGVVQSWEGKRIETMMRSSKKRNNVGKCASCKFIYLSLITLGIKFLPLFLGTKRDNLRFFLSWNKLKSSKKVLDESNHPFITYPFSTLPYIHKLFKRTKYRRITFEEHPESIESHRKITCSQLGRFIIRVQW